MNKKIVCFIVILIICLGLFYGCNQETDFNASASDDKAVVDTIENKDTTHIAVNEANTNNDEVFKVLDFEMERQVKQSYLDAYLKADHPEATIDDVSLRPFLGIYNGSFVAVFYGGKYHGYFPCVEITEEPEGIVFRYSFGYPILVFNEGSFFGLSQAYEQGLLTKTDLEKIHNLYYNK